MQNLLLQAHRVAYAVVRAIAIEFEVGEVSESHLPGGRINETIEFTPFGKPITFVHPQTKWRV